MSEIINAIKDTVQAGLDQDWITMGTGIVKVVAQGIDFISGFFG
ncbi:beta-class phenol-soluble modulin [Staphylococcus americanisciuri]|uniref:Beta-class phenol-soluble modulin n=1 Tax=Staphylococcus americanisciuri TaxID=2973940 RepID=A0ABT2F164_9STAP|nr:beta-class phenol-soluble modulin [Staphylococcus americanisciuri]MCS4486169.1 beta-class phenol-soluble modulin [Staphylococcus americanisciuri]